MRNAVVKGCGVSFTVKINVTCTEVKVHETFFFFTFYPEEYSVTVAGNRTRDLGLRTAAP